MKMLIMLGLSIMATLWSGCYTHETLETIKSGSYERENYLAAMARTESLLQRNFDAVFSHPAFLDDSRNADQLYRAEMEALQNHLKRMKVGGPTPEQIVKLIDWMKQRPDLTGALEYTWTSPHITMQQRIDYALWLDKHPPSRYSSITFSLLLPRRLFSDEQYRTLLSQMQPEGDIGRHIHHELEERRKLREKVKKELSELK